MARLEGVLQSHGGKVVCGGDYDMEVRGLVAFFVALICLVCLACVGGEGGCCFLLRSSVL